jgi:hypothetical protein
VLLSTILSGLAKLSVAFDAPVAAAVFGAAAMEPEGAPRVKIFGSHVEHRTLNWSTPAPRLQITSLNGAAAAEVHRAA